MNPVLRSARLAIEQMIRAAGGGPGAQTRVAESLGLQPPTISRTLSDDEKLPGTPTLAALATLGGFNGHWLLTGQGEPHAPPQEGGADKLYQDGIAEGIRRARRALEGLEPRPISPSKVASSVASRAQSPAGQTTPRKSEPGRARAARG